jgi:RNA polymerase sigma-32 factor
MFHKALHVLNPREKDILFKRRIYEKNITLDDLSKMYNISKERVRQIELNSIKKISKAIELMQ